MQLSVMVRSVKNVVMSVCDVLSSLVEYIPLFTNAIGITKLNNDFMSLQEYLVKVDKWQRREMDVC